MLRICLVFWKSEPQYAYKRYAYKKKTCTIDLTLLNIGGAQCATPVRRSPITSSQ